MKRIITTILLVLCIVGLQAQNRVFQEVASSNSHVTSTYIGPALIKFASPQIHIPTVGGSSVDDDFIKKIKSIEILSCEDAEQIPQVVAECKSIINSQPMELVIDSLDSDDQEVSQIYMSTDIDSGDNGCMVVMTYSPNDFNLVYISGKFDMSVLNSDQ